MISPTTPRDPSAEPQGLTVSAKNSRQTPTTAEKKDHIHTDSFEYPRSKGKMGLAGPKKRTKLSHDPNNTAWSRSTTNFGHKILTSQGWKPGDYLGAKDASHSSHYSAANASHIRVLLKDDNLGLGAKQGNQNAETFGLSQFSGLLGRLNGKSEDVLKKETDARRDVELRLWNGRKHGVMNFVSAGFLVGDKIEAKPRMKSANEVRTAAAGTSQMSEPEKVSLVVAEQPLKTEKKKKSDKKDKKSKDTPSKKRKRTTTDDVETATTSTASVSATDDIQAPIHSEEKESKEARRIRKAEKAARKLARQTRRDEKAARRAARAETKTKQKSKTKLEEQPASSSDSDADSDSESEPTTTTATSTPVLVSSVPTSGTSTPTMNAFGSIPRHAVRQRYIAQKRMAGMDPRALKEIFMIKT